MAEGGSEDKTSTGVPRSQSLYALDLECPICLEQLQHPKSLPCLHSFCQECLGSYITKELSGKMVSSSSFSCPVCRKITEPLNQSEDKKRWAEQFPTNNLAVEMIRHLLNTDDIIMTCTPCEKKGNVNIEAKFWCAQNKSYFCENCKTNLHDLVHGNCEPENITEWNKSSAIRRKMSATECEKHKEKLEYYCEDHQILGCNKCFIVDHLKCEVVTSVGDLRDKLTGRRIDRFLKKLWKCVDAMETLIKDADEQLQSMSVSKVTALQSLSDLRTKINDRLDTLQKELTDKLTALFKEEKENLDTSRQKCERLMFAMRKTLASFNNTVLMDESVETIRLFQRGQAEVESCKGLVHELEKSSQSNSLRHEYNPESQTSLTLGKMVVHQQHRRLPATPLSTPFSKHRLKMTGKFNIEVLSDDDACCAMGIVLLSAGRVVVADSNNYKVKLFTKEGDFHCEVGLDTDLGDLCRINDNTVAVALTYDKIICILTVQDLTLSIQSKIEVQYISGHRIEGITFANDSFVVSTGKSLYNISKTEGKDSERLHPIKYFCKGLAYDNLNGHIISCINSNRCDTSVAKIKLSDGSCTELLKVGVVERTEGIDVDMEGNVYVCGCYSHNVIQIAEGGTNVRELLTLSDGIKYPRAISLLGDQVVITGVDRNESNLVYMFQLLV
ncbi:tripartite motif-containing protein 2-like [Argopecten irradians]|uniref:tripartite motif-containing protein 2-like n=1 Tax=Argopecten irradians TaxID=31199 RepID=UPI003720344A